MRAFFRSYHLLPKVLPGQRYTPMKEEYKNCYMFPIPIASIFVCPERCWNEDTVGGNAITKETIYKLALGYIREPYCYQTILQLLHRNDSKHHKKLRQTEIYLVSSSNVTYDRASVVKALAWVFVNLFDKTNWKTSAVATKWSSMA